MASHADDGTRGVSVSFKSGGDLCLGFFQTFWDAGLLPELPTGAKVLEIGCSEADWLGAMRLARPDLHLTGIDWRDHPRPAADVQIQGDVLVHDFEPASFDAIIAVSMLEWAGVSHYGDPVDEQGDRKTAARARRWLKPGGWFYFDVPYAETDAAKDVFPGHPRNGHMRTYTDVELQDRILSDDWTEVTRRQFTGDGHPDGPYVALLLKPR